MRNKNANKTKIDYDVNVYVLEEYNRETGESYFNQDQWYLHVYDYYTSLGGKEASRPFLLTKEESFAMNFRGMDDIDEGLDGWLSMEYLMSTYWDQMSDRIRQYLEGFPKYKEDAREMVVYN